MARTLAEIEQEIAETKAALNDVHGTETEVYARIVGYYRAVNGMNLIREKCLHLKPAKNMIFQL